MNLDAKQQQALDKLSKLRAGALFMKMGTGKTKVACDLIRLKIEQLDAVIWIAPASLIRTQNYLNEVKKWAQGFFDKVRFYTVESIGASDAKYLEMRTFAENTTNFCVVDESIKIKNIDAKCTKRLCSDYHLFNYRFILNGTPLTKGLIDLYSQIQFLSPNILKMTERQFANNFLTYKKEGWKPWKRWSKPENEEALIEILRPYIFDAELDVDCGISEYDIDCFMSEEEKEEYQSVKNDYLHTRFDGQFLPLAQYLQHHYTRRCADKYKQFNELLCDILARGEKMIIYVKFAAEIERLKDSLDEYSYIVYTGQEKDDLGLFSREIDILLCTYGTGAMGLNLQCANNIIYLTQTFDYKEKEQSKHRVYRTGQSRDVNIYNFWVNTGLEKLIRQSLSKKQGVLQNIESIISKERAMEL